MSILYLTSKAMVETESNLTITLGGLAKLISMSDELEDLMKLTEKAYPGFISLCAVHDPAIDLEDWE